MKEKITGMLRCCDAAIDERRPTFGFDDENKQKRGLLACGEQETSKQATSCEVK
jgi:hypothetical protein